MNVNSATFKKWRVWLKFKVYSERGENKAWSEQVHFASVTAPSPWQHNTHQVIIYLMSGSGMGWGGLRVAPGQQGVSGSGVRGVQGQGGSEVRGGGTCTMITMMICTWLHKAVPATLRFLQPFELGKHHCPLELWIIGISSPLQGVSWDLQGLQVFSRQIYKP